MKPGSSRFPSLNSASNQLAPKVISFGDDLRQQALSSLRAAWGRGHWHPRFGLPDAFNSEISQAVPPTATVVSPTNSIILRHSGPWIQRSVFAIDQGPVLLHLENARSGLIWGLLAQNPNIQRSLRRLQALKPIALEGEVGSGDGQVQLRSNASGQKTVWLHAGMTRTLSFTSVLTNSYTFKVRYSNDNFGPLETININIDGTDRGQINTKDTGDSGFGWNIFAWSDSIGPVSLPPGNHEVKVSVSGGDGWGVEVDTLEFCSEIYCLHIPVTLKNH